MCGIEKIFDGAIDKYVSTPALYKFVVPNLDESEDCRMHCKAMGCVWAITARYECNLATESIKLTR